ncbi:AMP-binding protein [Streptomyces sp. NPDC056503]|uniref:AMP-binding protein n=1 Tax=Streptomyces sp. NPDC056503 TaxID=3345842 RepID=UPI0036B6E4F2
MPHKTLHGWFAAGARRVPDGTALVVSGERLSYAELDAASRHVARVVREDAPARPRIGLLASRSTVAYAAYLGVLRAGGCVVPLNEAYPAERNAAVASAAGITAVVAEPGQDTRFAREGGARVIVLDAERIRAFATDPGAPADEVAVDPDDTAYLLFTSGSTGRPKGVPIRHRNLDAFLGLHIERYAVGPGCLLSQTFDLTFDPSVFDMFVAWGSGATLVVPSRTELLDPVGFVNSRGITHWYSVPSLVTVAEQSGVLRPGSMPTLRWSLFAGERFTLAQAEAWARAAPGSEVENLYGPTELTVTVTAYRLPRAREEWPRTANGTVPIGAVHPHLEHRVSAEGELQVRGPQRFAGYLDPADDLGRFAGPGADGVPPGPEAWYRTGDRVEEAAGGLLHLGRLDHQVKVQGRRVELEEVEAALLAHAEATAAVVVPVEDGRGGLQLAAVCVGAVRDPARLRELLGPRLPAHMIPRRLVHVDRLPLNANGKADRAACEELAARAAAAGAPRSGTGAAPDPRAETGTVPDPRSGTGAAPDPRADATEVLLDVIRAHLPEGGFDEDSDFYASGGDSLIAVRVVADARRRGVPVSLRDLLVHQTVRGIVAAGAGRDAPAEAAPPGGAAERPFALLAPEDRDAVPEGVEEALPASALQIGMIYLGELSPDALLYRLLDGWEVRAPFDERSFRTALGALARRHPALRTSFDFEGLSVPAQLVWAGAEPPLSVVRAADEETALGLLEDWGARVSTSFDWRSPALLRCHVVALPGSFHVVLAAHHALLDGWSLSRLAVELMTLYQAAADGRDAALPEPSPDAQRAFLRAEREAAESAEAAGHWLGEARVPPLLLPDDGAHSGTPDAREHRAFPLGAGVVAGLQRAARARGVSPKATALAAHARALGSWRGRTRDVVTGLVFNTRPPVPGADLAAGLFLNTLPVRFGEVTGGWDALVAAAAEAERRGAPHAAYPQARLVERLGRRPFDVVFNFMNFHGYRELGGAHAPEVRGWWRRGKPSFPLHVNLEIDGDTAEVRIGFDPDLVAGSAVDTYAVLLRDALTELAEPAALSVPAVPHEGQVSL